MSKIKLFSSDLNGTLVHQHTMSDMIRIFIGKQQYEEANEVFKRQTLGTATMTEAFGTAGPLTKGLTLREAIEYTENYMKYLNGFHEFVDKLAELGIPLVINSTGYSVTIYAIIEQVGKGKIHGHIGNFLKFGLNGDPNKTLSEIELKSKVKEYFSKSKDNPIYDQIKATGEIELGIIDEEAKAKLIVEYSRNHFKHITPETIAHMGDTMGDSGGIFGIAKLGGMGIAFNYNNTLKESLDRSIKNEQPSGEIYFIDTKSELSNLAKVLPLIIKQ